MGKINLRESLLKLDKDTGFKYTLTDLYEACVLTESDKGKLAQYIDGKDIPGMSKMLSSCAGVMAENVSDDISDDELNEVMGNPAELSDCPSCGDISFDTKKGRCTKCSYRESLNEWFDDEDEEEPSEYEFVSRKSVKDSDDFMTDYTWYKAPDGLNVFVFGDSDYYKPEDGYFDHEEEDDQAAEEWFSSYNGFGDDEDFLDEGAFAVAGDALGRGVKDLWKGAKNFGKGLVDTGKDMAKTAKAVGKSIATDVKQSKGAAKARDAWRAAKESDNVDQFKQSYGQRQADRAVSNRKRNTYYKGKVGKSYGDTQDWKYVVNGKKMGYDQFMKLPEEQRIDLIKNKKVKCFDLSGREVSFQDQAKRLSDSLIREGKQLNEGPGAGYTIESFGYNMSGSLNGFTMKTNVNKWGKTEFIFDCDVSLTGEVESFYAEAAYSHTGVQHDLPITCDHVVVEVNKEDLISLGLFTEDAYETNSLTEDNVDKGSLLEIITDELARARCSFTYGGGWSHASYDGQVTEDYLSDIYMADIEADIFLFNEDDIRKVDRMTQGYGYETIYMVGDSGDYVEGFEDEDEAIAYAKENGYTEVRISYESEDWNGDTDSEYGDVVWEASEDVEESLREAREPQRGFFKKVGKCSIHYMGPGSWVVTNERGLNIGEAQTRSYAEEIAEKHNKGEMNESAQSAKTFSQWFDETSSDERKEYYPFSNYVQTFPNAEVLANATAEDIKNNAHQFYDVYDVDSMDREKAFHFASEELGMDYDDFYYAWLREKPIASNLQERGLTRAERHNRNMEKTFDYKRQTDNKMMQFLRDNSDLSEEEIKKAYDDDKLGLVIKELGLHDAFWSKNESLKEDWTLFEFESGSNPYIAKDEKEKNRILKKYGDKAKEVKPGFYEIDDTGDNPPDLFKFDSLTESAGGRFNLEIWVPGSGGDDRERPLISSNNMQEIIDTAYATELDSDEAFYLSDMKGIYPYDLDQCYDAEELEDAIYNEWHYTPDGDMRKTLGKMLLPQKEGVESSKEWEHKDKDGKVGRIRQSDGKGDRKPLTRDQAKEIAKFRGHEDDELYPVFEESWLTARPYDCGYMMKKLANQLNDHFKSDPDFEYYTAEYSEKIHYNIGMGACCYYYVDIWYNGPESGHKIRFECVSDSGHESCKLIYDYDGTEIFCDGVSLPEMLVAADNACFTCLYGFDFKPLLRSTHINKYAESLTEDHADIMQRKTSGYDKCYKEVCKALESNDYNALSDIRDHFGYDLYKMCLGDARKELGESFKMPVNEAFKPAESGVQSVKVYNQYNYTIQELRIDNDNHTFERGNFTMGRPDKKFKNRQQYEDVVDQLKELGYTEIGSDYQSLRNKSRKGVATEGVDSSANIARPLKENNSDEPEIKNVRGHYEAHKNGEVVCSGDTKKEVADELKNIEASGNEMTKYRVTWKIINKDDSYSEHSKEVVAKDEKSAKATVKDKRARDIQAIKLTEAFEHPQNKGPFWYLCKHGIGPGAIPKGVTVVDTMDDDENPHRCYVALDKVLTTDELKQFEMKEQKPPKMINESNEFRDSNGKVNASKWYASEYPDDSVGIEQLDGLYLDDLVKDRKAIGHCDTQVRDRVNKQLDNYIPVELKEAKGKRHDGYKGIKDRLGLGKKLTEDDDGEFIRFEVVPDNRKWQYSVGGKDVPYTSYEDAISHLKDDYNIGDYREELQQYLKSEGFDYFVDETFDGRLCIEIHRGDWKHEHRRADYLVRHFFMDKGLGVHVEEMITDEDGSDCYSAEHYYSINDLYFSGRVVENLDGEKKL